MFNKIVENIFFYINEKEQVIFIKLIYYIFLKQLTIRIRKWFSVLVCLFVYCIDFFLNISGDKFENFKSSGNW